MKKRGKYHIRSMIQRDMHEVLSIERASFEFDWDDDTFVKVLRQRNCIGMVAEKDDAVVGFMIYELHKTRLHVLNFAVDPIYRHEGVGRAMVDKLKSKLSAQRRSRILLEVRDSNLPAQLFFRAMSFKAVSVLRDFYEDTDDDAYVFQYRCPAPAIAAHAALDESEVRRTS